MYIEAKTVVLAFEERQLFCKGDQQGDRREGIDLSPLSEVSFYFYELGRTGCYMKALLGNILIGGLWIFVIYGKIQ